MVTMRSEEGGQATSPVFFLHNFEYKVSIDDIFMLQYANLMYFGIRFLPIALNLSPHRLLNNSEPWDSEPFSRTLLVPCSVVQVFKHLLFIIN